MLTHLQKYELSATPANYFLFFLAQEQKSSYICGGVCVNTHRRQDILIAQSPLELPPRKSEKGQNVGQLFYNGLPYFYHLATTPLAWVFP